MTIEFQCRHCEKLLKTTSDKAGRQAKCPGCGSVIDIPSQESSLVEDAARRWGADFDSASSIPDTPPKTRVCPGCASEAEISASQCEHCGERFDKIPPVLPRHEFRSDVSPFPPGEVIAEAWRIYSEQMGLLIGAFLATSILSSIAVVLALAPFETARALFDRDEIFGAGIAGFFGAILSLAAIGFVFFLQAGYLKLQLKVSRDQNAQFGDIFNGGKFAFQTVQKLVLNSIVFSLMISVGLSLCIIPGVLLALMFWPFAHVLIDEDRPGLGNLYRARQLTDGNWSSLVLVFIVATACNLAGYCSCGIGLIVTIPFVNLLYTVAYERMSCQRIKAMPR